VVTASGPLQERLTIWHSAAREARPLQRRVRQHSRFACNPLELRVDLAVEHGRIPRASG
jgi:hypothetical protein